MVVCLKFIINSIEILQFVFRGRNNSLSTRFPVSWAHFTMFISVLKSLNQTKSFINGTSYWQVVHGDLTKCTLRIDDEQTTKRDSSVFEKYSIVLRDFFGKITDERNVHFS